MYTISHIVCTISRNELQNYLNMHIMAIIYVSVFVIIPSELYTQFFDSVFVIHWMTKKGFGQPKKHPMIQVFLFWNNNLIEDWIIKLIMRSKQKLLSNNHEIIWISLEIR